MSGSGKEYGIFEGSGIGFNRKRICHSGIADEISGQSILKVKSFSECVEYRIFVEDNTLNVHISNLRNKLKAVCPDKEFIDTVWGIGYRLHKAKE